VKRDLPLRLIDLASLFVAKVLPWLLAIWLVYAVKEAAASLSGKDTLLGSIVELAGRVRVTRGFAFIFGGLGIFYGLQQRSLRHAAERYLRGRVAELEAKLQARESPK
jgi:hypothetical protein